MKRILILAVALLVLQFGISGVFADHGSDGMSAQSYSAPWNIIDWVMYWGPFSVDTCGGSDSTEASTRIVDTAYTAWLPMLPNADGYAFLAQITHQDTMFGVDSTETLSIDLQHTNNSTAATPTVYTVKTDAASDIEDTTIQKYFVNPDSFFVGSSAWIWGRHVRARIIRTIWPDSAACLNACYVPDTTLYDRTRIRLWWMPVDRY